ncbi:MAG: leucyl/phenylalanyl-tRNA--protein transferase [Planctomycetota bacterium]
MLAPDVPGGFPDPSGYDAEGLVAIGGDLAPERLVEAYSRGIFPWYGPGYVPLWWSPDPRALLTPDALHVSRSLHRTLRRGGFELRWDTRFRQVMRACGEKRTDGTWILPEMLDAYAELHRLGFAHSLEVLQGDQLVGGIYGVQVGGLFAAESMFHRVSDMSKVALVALVHTLFGAGIELLDVQFVTAHLGTLGAFEVPRADYLDRVAAARERVVDLRKPRLTLPV